MVGMPMPPPSLRRVPRRAKMLGKECRGTATICEKSSYFALGCLLLFAKGEIGTHPFAKNAKGWGTGVYCTRRRWASRPTTAVDGASQNWVWAVLVTRAA